MEHIALARSSEGGTLLIRVSGVLYLLGQFLLMMTVAMALPLVFTVQGMHDSPKPMLIGMGCTLLAGALLFFFSKKPETELSIREALFTVFAVWVSVAFFGCLPFYFSPHFASFTDAFFESASGFTTTGATILTDVEVLPRSLQFWRHFAHWLGGMGIIMLGIAILPLVGIGGKALYHAQFAGAQSETLKPRVLETAHALWKVYFAITIAEFLALWWAGMDSFDAICHSFSTLGTGGFSTRNASIAAFESPLIENIIIVFMILSSLNFTTQYKLWVERRPGRFVRDPEISFHLAVLSMASALAALTLVRFNGLPLVEAVRQAAFQVCSIGTTTGFITADYEQWHPFGQLLLLALMYLGGNTGSTAGGFKTFRVVLLLRAVDRAFVAMHHPRQVLSVRVGKETIPEGAVSSLLNLILMAILFNFAASLLLAATGLDLLTCFSAVPACMFSVGPAFGAVGAVENYAHLPVFAKWVLSATMLAGRVEFYTALVLVTPFFWRK